MMALPFNSIHSASLLGSAACLVLPALRSISSPMSAHLFTLGLASALRVNPTHVPPLAGPEGEGLELGGAERSRGIGEGCQRDSYSLSRGRIFGSQLPPVGFQMNIATSFTGHISPQKSFSPSVIFQFFGGETLKAGKGS